MADYLSDDGVAAWNGLAAMLDNDGVITEDKYADAQQYLGVLQDELASGIEKKTAPPDPILRRRLSAFHAIKVTRAGTSPPILGGDQRIRVVGKAP